MRLPSEHCIGKADKRASSVEDTSIRYVAEENIDIIELDVPVSLMSLAGRYFKRWDPGTHRFISNIKDEYPHN